MQAIKIIVISAMFSFSLVAAAVAHGEHGTKFGGWKDAASNWGTKHCNQSDQSGCVPK